jgi:hypothetical protein
MHKILFAMALAFISSSAWADCPMGSYPWVDNWGTQICKRYDGGSTSTIQGSLNNCPMGTYPSVDSWGNRICQSFGGGNQYYDTSRGCPMSTHPWVDSWGNSICKRF